MNKLVFLALFSLPLFAMQDSDDKGYCEQVMGSLVLVKETSTPNGSHIEGTFRKGDKVSCMVDADGNPTAKIVT